MHARYEKGMERFGEKPTGHKKIVLGNVFVLNTLTVRPYWRPLMHSVFLTKGVCPCYRALPSHSSASSVLIGHPLHQTAASRTSWPGGRTLLHWAAFDLFPKVQFACPTSFTRHCRRNQPNSFSQCTSLNRTNLNHTSAITVTRQEAGRLGYLGLIPDVEYFLVSTAIRPVLGPTQPPTQRVPQALQTRVTRPWRPVDINRRLLSRLRIQEAVIHWTIRIYGIA
jgi:hypothetical protein